MAITSALWITLIGMGLVFVAIVFLWGLMALIVRITAEKEKAPGEETGEGETAPDELSSITSGDGLLLDRKRRAAAAAVAAAISLARAGQQIQPSAQARPSGALSQWQAVNRASQLNQIQNASRKKVAR